MRFIVLPVIAYRDGKLPAEISEQIVACVKKALLETENVPENVLPRAVGRPPKCARTSDELIGEFIRERCSVGPDEFCNVAQMWRAFQQWTCGRYGCMPLSRETFAIGMSLLGFAYRRTRLVADKQMRTWEGVSVKIAVVPTSAAAPRVEPQPVFDELTKQLAVTLELLKKRLA